jgi:hypothetical protein
VTKPGGFVAVLESDTLHHLILPWPIEIELSVRAAELATLAKKSDKPRKFYVGRLLRSVFRQAGFGEFTLGTIAHDRAAPLGPDEQIYFTEHLKGLSERVSNQLEGAIRRKFDALVDPDSAEFLLRDPDLTTACIDQLA